MIRKRQPATLTIGTVLIVVAAASLLQACHKAAPTAEKAAPAKPAAATPNAATAPAKPAASMPQTKGRDGAIMVEIPAGEFMMGSEAGDRDEKPVHRVKLAAFSIDVYPVTNAQFAAFLNATKKTLDGSGHRLVGTFRRGVHLVGRKWEAQKGFEQDPAIGVSWYGAAAYAKHYGKRLPTEAEWEYACRAGTASTWSFGDEVARLVDFAWFKGNAGEEVHPVGEKAANAWGLHDMPGSVWEWCADWYGDTYYRHSGSQNPKGPSSGFCHVLRGGSRLNGPARLRSSNRGATEPDDRDGLIGFRCAASAK